MSGDPSAAWRQAVREGDDYEALRGAGYAPGRYYCICADCGQTHSADKRAVRCLPCARVAVSARPAIVPAQEV